MGRNVDMSMVAILSVISNMLDMSTFLLIYNKNKNNKL
jgi:hypothetical protein